MVDAFLTLMFFYLCYRGNLIVSVGLGTYPHKCLFSSIFTIFESDNFDRSQGVWVDSPSQPVCESLLSI